MNWKSHDGSAAISRTDIAGDLLALIRHLGGPAVIIGQWRRHHRGRAVARTRQRHHRTQPVHQDPETRPGRDVHRLALPQGMLRLLGTMIFKSLGLWTSYLNIAYPIKPADHDQYLAELTEKLREPGRFADFMKTGKSTPADAEAQLPNLSRDIVETCG